MSVPCISMKMIWMKVMKMTMVMMMRVMIMIMIVVMMMMISAAALDAHCTNCTSLKTVQWTLVRCSASFELHHITQMQYNTTQFNTIQYNTVLACRVNDSYHSSCNCFTHCSVVRSGISISISRPVGGKVKFSARKLPVIARPWNTTTCTKSIF